MHTDIGRIDGQRPPPRSTAMDPDADPLESVNAGTGTFAAVRSSWAELARNSLPARLQASLLRRLCGTSASNPPVLNYASDCSGVDAPKHATEDIIDVVFESAKKQDADAVHAKLRYLFASEAPDRSGLFPKILLTLNGLPDVLVSDMHARTVAKQAKHSSVSAFDEYTQRTQALGTPDVYTVGFECQDRSVCNTWHPKELGAAVTDEAGASTKTLHSSMKFIAAAEPGIVIFEHTFRTDTVAQLAAHMLKLKIYAFRWWVTSTINWGRPMKRRRIFGIGINMRKNYLLEAMPVWTRVLEKMAAAQARQPVPLQECLLPPRTRRSASRRNCTRTRQRRTLTR